MMHHKGMRLKCWKLSKAFERKTAGHKFAKATLIQIEDAQPSRPQGPTLQGLPARYLPPCARMVSSKLLIISKRFQLEPCSSEKDLPHKERWFPVVLFLEIHGLCQNCCQIHDRHDAVSVQNGAFWGSSPWLSNIFL